MNDVTEILARIEKGDLLAADDLLPLVYEELRRHYRGTGVLLYCCGAPPAALGMEDEFERVRRELLRMVEQVGAEELVTACPECTHTMKARFPELKITTVWENLAGHWVTMRLAYLS